jgi:ribonuclease HI
LWESIPLAAGCAGTWTGTNNVAELMGALAGIQKLLQLDIYKNDRSPSVVIISDSKYVINMSIGKYEPKVNVELVCYIRNLCDQYNISLEWVRGHSGNPINDICDWLAKRAKKRNAKLCGR